MSVVADVVEPDAGKGAANAVDAVNDHTPEPEQPPVVDRLPDPPAPEDGLAALRETVESLAATVQVLSDAVMKATPDESPTSVPWTHWGSAARDDE